MKNQIQKLIPAMKIGPESTRSLLIKSFGGSAMKNGLEYFAPEVEHFGTTMRDYSGNEFHEKEQDWFAHVFVECV